MRKIAVVTELTAYKSIRDNGSGNSAVSKLFDMTLQLSSGVNVFMRLDSEEEQAKFKIGDEFILTLEKVNNV